MNATFNLVMDIIGTIAFAISGVMVASKKKMDLFGIKTIDELKQIFSFINIIPPHLFFVFLNIKLSPIYIFM